MGNTILLVLPVPFQSRDGQLGFDQQTCQGLMRWAEQFERVIMACPLQRPGEEANASLEGWCSIATLPCADRLSLVPLPWAYEVVNFIKAFGPTRKRLGQLIAEADYICVSPSTIAGDWPALAALEARNQNRSYAVWIDRVEYDIAWRTRHTLPLHTRLSYAIILPLTKLFQHYLVRQSALGLFQGKETFNVFKDACAEPHCVYDVHTTRQDQLSSNQLQEKLASTEQGPLRIAYMGRAAEMKGPLDWIKAVHRIWKAGVEVEATWLGSGPLMADMKALVHELGMEAHIHMPGFTQDHQLVLEEMRRSHLLMFCHKTPESPRCLVESLVVGTPIVGYGSAYPKGLVEHHGGGEFVEIHRWEQLADRIVAISQDRDRLKQLIEAAARDGQRFSEEDMFAHRSDLLRQHLGAPVRPNRPVQTCP